ncbi:MAG: ABC transporter substrate-binding protein [Acidimicrobiales bacterium]
MRRPRLLAVLAGVATLSLALAAVPMSTTGAATQKNRAPTVKYGGVLPIAMPWGSILDNFNPLTPGGTGATAGGTGSLIYEPLFYANPVTGKITSLLGTAYKWQDNNLQFVVTTRQGVKWSDGKPFSASDVAFTFNYLRRFPAFDTNAIWKSPLKSVKATNSDTVVFQFASPYTPIFLQLVAQEIIPRHIWSKISNPVTFTNPKPVGTGPFLLKSYTSFRVTYVKNPNYWMAGLPYLNGVIMTAVKSNTTAELLILNAGAAWTYDAITDPQKTFVAAAPKYNHYWWPSVALNLLYFNMTEAPFNDVAVRKAVAEALDTTVITDRAYYGALPVGDPTAVTTGQLSTWVTPSVTSLEWHFSVSAALATLTAAGYKVVGGKLEAPDGTAFPTFNLLIGGPGWTDYISIAQTISLELQAIGISTNIVQDTFATYYAALQTGHFDLAVCWSNNNNPTPYYEYYDLLSSKETAPVGSTANTNWERFSSPTVDAALSSYASTSDLAVQKADMVTIEKAVLTQVPVVSLTARPNWFDYSTKYYVGWSSASNPYNAGEAPDAFGGGGELIYLNVHRR